MLVLLCAHRLVSVLNIHNCIGLGLGRVRVRLRDRLRVRVRLRLRVRVRVTINLISFISFVLRYGYC